VKAGLQRTVRQARTAGTSIPASRRNGSREGELSSDVGFLVVRVSSWFLEFIQDQLGPGAGGNWPRGKVENTTSVAAPQVGVPGFRQREPGIREICVRTHDHALILGTPGFIAP
jgi:hypothetical protein